jgi:hypothetical protein
MDCNIGNYTSYHQIIHNIPFTRISNPLPHTYLDDIVQTHTVVNICMHLVESLDDAYRKRHTLYSDEDEFELSFEDIMMDSKFPDSLAANLIADVLTRSTIESNDVKAILTYRPWLLFPYSFKPSYFEVAAIRYRQFLPDLTCYSQCEVSYIVQHTHHY